ncbi:MAG: LemA family protein [Magnetococcales bacterium]|nr:LemA family protein [Magnetococcales bacterium]
MAERREDPLEQLNGLGPETSNSERMRRMRRLLGQLYKDESETQRLRVPPIKVKGLILFLSFVSILAFGITTLYNFNIFITLEERILSAQGYIQDAIQRRANLFTNLINLTLNQAALEQEVFRHVANVRAAMTGRDAGNSEAATTTPGAVPGDSADAKGTGLAETLAGMEGPASMARLMAVVEQYPEIKSSTTYQQLMDKLVEIEDRIIQRRDTYNEEVRVYNTLITSFPWYILANITGFKRYDYFTMEHLSQDEKLMLPDLTSTLFKRLLPLDPDHPPPAGGVAVPPPVVSGPNGVDGGVGAIGKPSTDKGVAVP